MSNWRLKSGYRENLTRQTWEENQVGSYWTPERIRLSGYYQYEAYLLAREIAGREHPRSALDIGSGPGIKAATLLADVVEDLVLVDQPTVAGLVAAHCPRARFVAADLDVCDVEIGQHFDLIMCIDVLEHLIDPTACFDFMKRHAGPGTWFVLSTPERDYLHGLTHNVCNKPEHVREWNGLEFAGVLEDMGFVVHEHWVSPQISDERVRGDIGHLITFPYVVAGTNESAKSPDPRKGCQICICRYPAH